MKKNILQKYKSIIIPLVFIVASIFIISQVTLPTIATSTDLRAEIANKEKKLTDYKNSLTILSAINNTEDLNKDFKLVSVALPVSKNLQEIFLAINSAAGESNVALSGFLLQAGEVFDKNKKAKSQAGSPVVSVKAELVNLNENSLISFIEKLNSNFPLSKITKIDLTRGRTGIDIDFYYEAYDLNKINSNEVFAITSQEREILKKLSR